MADQINTIVAKVLKQAYPDLPLGHENHWEILDQYPTDLKGDDLPELVLVHYRIDKASDRPLFDIYNEFNQSLLFLRGIVIDLKNERILVASHGYDHVLSVHEPLSLEDGKIIVKAYEAGRYSGSKNYTVRKGKDLAFDVKKTKIHPFMEGVVLRVFMWKGKVFISNYKKLNAGKSKWESGETFVESFLRLLNEDYETFLDKLFPENNQEKVESKVYTFLISPKGLRMVTSFTEEKIFLLGSSGEVSEDLLKMVPYQGSFDDIEIANGALFPNKTEDSKWFQSSDKLAQGELRYQFNTHEGVSSSIEVIHHGWNTPLMGEALLLEVEGEGVWKILSPGFCTREIFLGRSPNLYSHFVHQIRAIVKGEFPFSFYPHLEYVDGKKPQLASIDGRLKLYAEYMYYSANVHHREDIRSFPERANKDFDSVINFIINGKYNKIPFGEKREGKIIIPTKIGKRFQDIDQRTQKYGHEVRYHNIEGFLNSEMGASLYGMIKSVHKYELLVREA